MDSILPNGRLTWKECDDIGELSTCSVLGRDHGCEVPSFFECRLCRFEQAIVVDGNCSRAGAMSYAALAAVFCWTGNSDGAAWPANFACIASIRYS